MKPSLALQFLSTAFTATVAVSSSSVSVAEAVAKKYDNHRDIGRNLESTSKAGKSSAYCPPEPIPGVQCGNTYTDSTVILGQNLICTEGRDGAEAALHLKGKKALLDCQGYTISQNTNSSSAALDCPQFGQCGLFYDFGVILEAGAIMKNCNIKKFYVGSFMVDGGEIKDSEFSLNRDGVQIVNDG
jgi:hypothetical protein